MNGLLQIALHVHILTHVDEHARHAGVLADGHVVRVRDAVILDDLIQDALGHREGFVLPALHDAILQVLRQVTVGLDAQPAHDLRHLRRFDVSHGFLLYMQSLFHTQDFVDLRAVAVDDVRHLAATARKLRGLAGDALGDLLQLVNVHDVQPRVLQALL